MFEVEVHRPAVSGHIAAIISDLSDLAAQMGALTLKDAWSGPLASPAHQELSALQAAANQLVTEGKALLRLAGAENALFHDVNRAVTQAQAAAVAASTGATP